ncbi:hypothetical protein ACWGI0_04960 [Streptomyces sp. NPDC054802]
MTATMTVDGPAKDAAGTLSGCHNGLYVVTGISVLTMLLTLASAPRASARRRALGAAAGR